MTAHFLSPAELSSRWSSRIGVRTLANWRSQGCGPRYVKIGGAIGYRLTDIEKWEENNTVTSTSEYGRKLQNVEKGRTDQLGR